MPRRLRIFLRLPGGAPRLLESDLEAGVRAVRHHRDALVPRHRTVLSASRDYIHESWGMRQGPGTSGHAILLKTGRATSAVFGGNFDIVSWDPRGVNMSTPRISRARCHSTELQRQLFSLSHHSGDLDFYDMVGSAANSTLLEASARAELLTELCRDAVGDRVLRSVTTVNVARDLEEMRKAIGEGGLRYWGFSYGTTLGATYAAMFPENAFDGFVSSCLSAGPSRCALVQNGTLEPSQLSRHILSLLTRLRTAPLPVTHPNSQAVPSILLPSDLLQSIYATLLRPTEWATLASAIAELENGDGTDIASLSGTGGKAWDLLNLTDAEHAENAGWDSGREMGTSEADMAISCGDAPPFPTAGNAAWMHTWLDWRKQLVSSDAISGPVWFKKMVRCRHWGRIHPAPERYEGQWKMGHDLKPPEHPILFVSNTYPSLCIGNAIREYMIDGTLPAEGTVCQPENGTIFSLDGALRVQHEEWDELMFQALNNLSQAGLGSS
ncbi:hypothetical protein B0H12DRAFT_1067863 [Mycena haematopus]|nr:hypothetical protein B0H12DRAFT_1067863 [Mycena haematopus]